MESHPVLAIAGLAARHPGLTEAIAASYEQAAAVCLARHHQSPTDVVVDDTGQRLTAQTSWGPIDDRTRNAWANKTDATEAGAYAVVLAAVELRRRMFAVRRAETTTGADYYVAPPGRGIEDLEDCLRLEISGTDASSESELKSRLVKKQQQAANGSGSLPAVAGVVGFALRQVLIADVA